VQSSEQRPIELLSGRGFVFAEEDSEVALTQAARKVGGVAESSARRRAERKRNEQVVAEQSRSIAAPGRAALVSFGELLDMRLLSAEIENRDSGQAPLGFYIQC
jgi:hypothetical protein